MPLKKNDPTLPASSEESSCAAKPGSVMVQKRVVQVEPVLREKLCATCGKPFLLSPEQKFYICPDCYRKTQAPLKKTIRKGEAQVLIQIRCASCGTVEYLDFVPSDPSATYCRACFAKRKREPRP